MQLFSIIILTVKTRNIYNGPEAIASQSWLTNMLADNKLILTMPSSRNSVPTILLNPLTILRQPAIPPQMSLIIETNSKQTIHSPHQFTIY